MAISYQSAGAIGVNATGVHTFNVAHPASIAAGDALVLIIGQKPATAGGGAVTDPGNGWALLGTHIGGGYGATLGADTGNTRLTVFTKIAAGGESGNLSVTCTDNNAAWGIITRLSNATGRWFISMATGEDISAGNVSIAFGATLGMKAGDYVLGAMCIPTDVTTPSQFSAAALSQTGITFGTVSEIGEPDNAAGNDLGGFLVRAAVSSGTASANPTMTATAGGTTTNVRGPGVLVRLREMPELVADSGSYALSGAAAELEFDRQIAAQGDGYVLTGQAAVLQKGQTLGAAEGSYALTGASGALEHDRQVIALSGSYALTGANGALEVGRQVVAAAGAYALNGAAGTLEHDRQMVAAGGSYELSAAPLGLLLGRQIVSEIGVYALSGSDAHLQLARLLEIEAGGYELVGMAAALDYQAGGTAPVIVLPGDGLGSYGHRVPRDATQHAAYGLGSDRASVTPARRPRRAKPAIERE